MTKVSRSKCEFLILCVIALFTVLTLYHHLVEVKRGKTVARDIERQLSSSMIASDDLDQRHMERLQLLTQTLSWPLAEEYKAEQWLSALQKTVLEKGLSDGFSARMVESKQIILGRHEDIELISTPIDLELISTDPAQVVGVLDRADYPLGSYSSVDYCDVRRDRRSGELSGFGLRCRVNKISYRRVDP